MRNTTNKKVRLMDSSSSQSHATYIQRIADQTYLTEDFWYEIFLHLPLNSIFRFRCVSKVWLSILSNPNFINNWYKLNSLLWTLIHGTSISVKNNPTARLNSSATGSFKLSCPELKSQFISHHQSLSGFSFRFVNQKHELKNTKLYVIGSSNGLVLCTPHYYYQRIYYVCNPLTKRWVLLPPPPRVIGDVLTGFTCNDCCFSSSLMSVSYKVIRVTVYEMTATFKVEIFSSDLGEWNVYDVLCPPGFHKEYSSFDNFVTHAGVFYWMQKVVNKILVLSVNRDNKTGTCGNECRLINLPDRPVGSLETYLSHCLGESEGCYAVAKHTERTLSVWVLEDNKWFLLHKDFKFYDVLTQMYFLLIGEESMGDLIREIQVLGFSPIDKNVVIFAYKKHIWAYNVRTRGYEQLCHPSFLVRNLSGPRLGMLTFFLKPLPTIIPPVSW